MKTILLIAALGIVFPARSQAGFLAGVAVGSSGKSVSVGNQPILTTPSVKTDDYIVCAYTSSKCKIPERALDYENWKYRGKSFSVKQYAEIMGYDSVREITLIIYPDYRKELLIEVYNGSGK